MSWGEKSGAIGRASPEDKGNIKMPQKYWTLSIMPQDATSRGMMGMAGGRPKVLMCFMDVSHL